MPSLANNYVVYSGFWRLSRPWHALHVFPHLAPIARFLARGTDCTFSRAWHRLLAFPRLVPIARFPAFGTGYSFSRAAHRLHGFLKGAWSENKEQNLPTIGGGSETLPGL